MSYLLKNIFILFIGLNMKKLLWTLLAVCAFLGVGLGTAYASDCLNLNFGNWDSVCLGIEKSGTKNFKISVDKNNLSKSSSIKCYVILPNSSMYSLNNCEWTFSYSSNNTDGVVVSATYILKNKDFYSKRMAASINFNKWTRWSSSSSSSKSDKNLKITTSPSSPDTYDWVKLTIKTDKNYTGKIKFSKFQYRSSSSSSWSNISSTSSTYVSDYSTDWSNGYYRMTSSDKGEATLKNLIKFKKSGYYRIYVEDTDGNESYVQINVDTSSSSSSSSSSYNDEIELSTNRTSPSTSQYVNLTIETDDDYVGKLTLSAKYRKSSSDSWSSISNTSSTYFTDYSDEWDDGYYRMTSSDDGEITLKNLVKFRKDGYYRIYVEDTDGNESYIQFSVGDDDDDDDDESKVSGFSTSELSKVKSIYKQRNSLIGQMQRKYPSLKKDTYWIKLSDNLYDDMKDVINDKKYRDFDDYDDFKKAFDDWYKYTTRNI